MTGCGAARSAMRGRRRLRSRLPLATGAGSRTVERRRGGSGWPASAAAAAMRGRIRRCAPNAAGDERRAGAGGALSRSATASLSSGSGVAGAADSSSAGCEVSGLRLRLRLKSVRRVVAWIG